jgi:hypothetical protein
MTLYQSSENLIKDLVGGSNQHPNHTKYSINQHESHKHKQINNPPNQDNNIGQDTDEN